MYTFVSDDIVNTMSKIDIVFEYKCSLIWENADLKQLIQETVIFLIMQLLLDTDYLCEKCYQCNHLLLCVLIANTR